MTTWNHRIVKYKRHESDKKPEYELCEVFYDSKHRPFGFGVVEVIGETKDILKMEYETMAEAFKYPILEWKNDNFYQGGKKIKRGDMKS